MDKPCSECGGQIKEKRVSQKFERGGVQVSLSGIRAWVCIQCGEIYFRPGGADQFAKTVDDLFALAVVEEQHKGTLVASVAL
jgi:YgiT-type zinc finger domain-containing protein